MSCQHVTPVLLPMNLHLFLVDDQATTAHLLDAGHPDSVKDSIRNAREQSSTYLRQNSL